MSAPTAPKRKPLPLHKFFQIKYSKILQESIDAGDNIAIIHSIGNSFKPLPHTIEMGSNRCRKLANKTLDPSFVPTQDKQA